MMGGMPGMPKGMMGGKGMGGMPNPADMDPAMLEKLQAEMAKGGLPKGLPGLGGGKLPGLGGGLPGLGGSKKKK